MAANNPHQGVASARRMSSPSRAREGGGGDPQLGSSSTASFPPLSTSSDNTSNSISSGTSFFNSGSPGGERARGSPKAKGERHRRPRRAPAQDRRHRALCQQALMENDAMVYLSGPGVYTCGHCRTHLTSHDDIISKSFHGRHGRAYLFDQCVNITTGPSEERLLITGLHSVCDISCKRCHTLIGWAYVSAYERSQKYKEGKFIIEKKFLHLEESDQYDVDRPAGERGDRWRQRSMSWGSERRSARSVSIGSHAERSWSIGSHAEMTLGSPSGGASPQGPS